MYIPMLHARQSERLAVLKIKQKIHNSQGFLPLIIPVKDKDLGSGSGLRGVELLVKQFSSHRIPYLLLTTPYAKGVPYGQKEILLKLAHFDVNRQATVAVAVTRSKPVSALQAEIAALGERNFAVLHQSPSDDLQRLEKLLAQYSTRILRHVFYKKTCDPLYWDRWKSSSRALIHDGFRKLEKNALYAAKTDEEFSDLAFNYPGLGFQAYGDHTICGEEFTPGGGEPYAIAIHLTHPAPIETPPYTTINIRHFVSTNMTPETPEFDRYIEALTKLVAFYRKYKSVLSFSEACREFEQWFTIKHYPKLGPVKQLTIQHHLELMLHLNK